MAALAMHRLLLHGKAQWSSFLMLIIIAACATKPEAIIAVESLQNFADDNQYELHVWHQGLGIQILQPKLLEAIDTPLNVFIGGDGEPWVRGGRVIASNPTRFDNTVYGLMKQSTLASIFLIRPCYYVLKMPLECDPELWTSARYSEQVVASMERALRQLVLQQNITSINLIGFSGGASLAVLIAARADDALPVNKVVSIAGNLAVKKWVAYHNYLPLRASLEPQNQLPLGLPHLIMMGADDVNVPPLLLLSQGELFDELTEVAVYNDVDHSCCWIEQASRLNEFLMRP